MWKKVTAGALVLTVILLLLASPVIAYIIHYEWMARPRTVYCDNHHRSDLTTCCILDEREGRVLVQHSDLDFNIFFLEIVDGDTRREFAMPDSITRLAPQGYVARLVPGESEAIEIVLGDDDDGMDEAAVDWSEAAQLALHVRVE